MVLYSENPVKIAKLEVVFWAENGKENVVLAKKSTLAVN